MTNVLLVNYNMEPTAVITSDFFTAVSDDHGLEFRCVKTIDVKEEDIEWSDVLLAVRTQSILELDIMKKAKSLGVFCIEMVDDDFLGIKDYELRKPFEAKAFKDSVRECDAVLTTSDRLAEKLRKLSGNPHKPCAIIDTPIVESELYPWRDKLDDNIRIVYYMSDGTTFAFDEIIRPVLKSLSKKYGGKIEFTFLSAHPDISEYKGSIKANYVGGMTLPEFRKFMAEGNFSIGISPILDNEFSKSKYVNKFMEFTRAAIPGIYSNVEPYRGFVNDGRDGILADNNPDSWMSAFERIIDSQFGKTIAVNAQERLRRDFSKENTYRQMVTGIPQMEKYQALHTGEAGGIRILHIKASVINAAEFMYKIYARIRYEGLKSTVTWIRDYYILKKR